MVDVWFLGVKAVRIMRRQGGEAMPPLGSPGPEIRLRLPVPAPGFLEARGCTGPR